MSLTFNTSFRWFFCVFICLVIGGIGSVAHHATVDSWYSTLIKPVGTPPNWVFPIIWTILYVLMGTAWSYFWSSPGQGKLLGWIAFFTQLFLNFLWPWIFFYMELPGIALFEIIVLWFAIVVTVYAFFRHSWVAALLMVPYLLWVTYAVYLNFGIVASNG